MSLVARAPRNHPQQAVLDAVDDRKTPLAIFEPLHRQHDFTIDVAASAENARCERFYTQRDDALLRSWSGERVWCNPPFSRLEPWLAKAWSEMQTGCELVVMLLPANRCEQPWWQKHVEKWRDGIVRDGIRLTTRFLAGRYSFRAPDQRLPLKGDRPPVGVVLLTWEEVP